MLACNKAKKLYSEWKQDEWNTLKDKPVEIGTMYNTCLLYTSPSPRD